MGSLENSLFLHGLVLAVQSPHQQVLVLAQNLVQLLHQHFLLLVQCVV